MADKKNLLAGTAYLTVDGISYPLVGEFSYNPSFVTRESLVGMDGPHGYSEKPRVGAINGTIRDMGSLSVAALNAMTNVTVVAVLANGKTIIGRNMWTVEDQSAKAEDGTIEIKWEGPSVTEN